MRLLRKKSGRSDRRGTAIVETAVVLPIFFTFIFGFIEFGHVFMTIHTLNSAARRAARLGVGESSTTAQVETLAHDVLNSAINADLENVVIMVKDASVFDSMSVNASQIDYDSLPDVNIEDLEPRSLFLVRIQVPYNEVGILGPRWISGLNLYGQSVMRKE
ncbi:MAG: pilus assembly protein [Planctomycetaceae bacterium]|nr:pilus assembly protein [Planctomycetaceae bacterium]